MITGRKILTVDDSEMVRMMVMQVFMPHLVAVIEAGNGLEGLAQAERENPDLIFLDITMPVMDGIAMLQRLKGDPVLRKIPVVVLTAESGRVHTDRMIDLGAYACLNKPFKAAELIELTKHILVGELPEPNSSSSPPGCR